MATTTQTQEFKCAREVPDRLMRSLLFVVTLIKRYGGTLHGPPESVYRCSCHASNKVSTHRATTTDLRRHETHGGLHGLIVDTRFNCLADFCNKWTLALLETPLLLVCAPCAFVSLACSKVITVDSLGAPTPACSTGSLRAPTFDISLNTLTLMFVSPSTGTRQSFCAQWCFTDLWHLCVICQWDSVDAPSLI